MAQYKVPQDVEADDKLIGPFTFKQFVFILLAIGMAYLAYAAGRVNFILAVLPIPFMLIFLILGLPLRKDQPTDVYVAALINFWLRPKIRLWGQEGMTEHVNITVPKKEARQFSDGLSRTEVKSRLSQLAKTMDTRGWSVKNIDVTGFASVPGTTLTSDRLVAPSAQPSELSYVDESQIDDMLDTQNSRAAKSFARLEAKATETTQDKTALKEQKDVSKPSNIAANQLPGAQFLPNQRSSILPTPRTVSEVAAIADANHPVTHDPAAPTYTGENMTDEVELKLDDINYNPYQEGIRQKVVKPLSSDETVAKSETDMSKHEPEDHPKENNEYKQSDTASTSQEQVDIIDPENQSSASETKDPADADLDQGGEVSLH